MFEPRADKFRQTSQQTLVPLRRNSSTMNFCCSQSARAYCTGPKCPCLENKCRPQLNSAIQLVQLNQRFPTWGLCTPGVHLPIWRVHVRLSIEDKYMFAYYSFPNIYAHIS